MMRFSFHHLAAVAVVTALGLPGVTYAQYVWLDDKGTKQFSDMPPPPSVPSNRILRQPGGAMRPVVEPAPPAQDAPAAAPARAEMTTAEKNAEFRKRKAEQEEKEKKAKEEARVAADKAKQCDRAREYGRTLESGERVSRLDRNGERTFMTDDQRAQELRDVRRVLEGCK